MTESEKTGTQPGGDPRLPGDDTSSSNQECCPNCGVAVGEFHQRGCDVEPCAKCGRQRVGCFCDHRGDRIPWSGEWPGTAECRDFGWYARDVPGKGWITCAPGDPGAELDISRLPREAVWDSTQRRWVRALPCNTRRYTLLWRNKWLTADAKSIDDMIDAYQSTLDHFRQMKAAGVVLEDNGGAKDDHATLATNDSKVAEEFEFEEEEEDEFDREDEDEEEPWFDEDEEHITRETLNNSGGEGVASLRHQLAIKLLSIGGDRVVIGETDSHIRRLLEEGRHFTEEILDIMGLLNSDALGRCYKLSEGYALADDGVWRSHKWFLDGGRLIDARGRKSYYGMTCDEAKSSEVLHRLRLALACASLESRRERTQCESQQ